MVGERTPHSEQSLLSMGAPPAEADAAVVALHGRGATARSILRIVAQLGLDDVAGVAPQASRNTWYPTGFMEPTEKNEPWLSAALSTVGETVASVEEAGVPVDRTVLLGFSQGACLASEFVARNARRYGGLVAFSGGLVGPPGTPREYEGSLDGTPVFLGCSDRDPHIPLDRVHETATVLEELGGDVDERIYEGMGHTVNEDELEAARRIVASAARPTPDRR